MSGIVPDTRHGDRVQSWRPACEVSGTLSRSHPKVKKYFEEWNRQFEAEEAAKKEKLESSNRPTAGQERVDVRWRKPDPEQFVVRPFAAFRLTHDGMRLGMQDLVATSAKIGTNALVMIKLKTQFEAMNVAFNTYVAIEQSPGGVFEILDNYNKHIGQVSALEGVKDYNTLLAEETAALDILIAEASKGNHESAMKIMRAVPEVANLVEISLQAKEEVFTKYGLSAALDKDANSAAIVKGALDNARDQLSKHLAPFMTKQLAAKRPFGNVKMYVAALNYGSTPEQFAAMQPALARAAKDDKGNNIWDKIAAFL